MKKSKYRVDIYLGDNMLETSVDITASKFKSVYTDLMQQHKTHDDTNQEFYTEYSTKNYDLEKETVDVFIFSYGINEIYLYHSKCKDGYCYKR